VATQVVATKQEDIKKQFYPRISAVLLLEWLYSHQTNKQINKANKQTNKPRKAASVGESTIVLYAELKQQTYRMSGLLSRPGDSALH
jgi:Ni,Fe-hydrogenase III small subunit